MTPVLEIITDAYRESNTIGIGTEPNENQQREALRRLNAVISSAYGFEVGEALQDWMVGNTNIETQVSSGESRWTRPLANVRLLLNAQSPQKLFLPARVDDGARIAALDVLGTLATYPVTIQANGRKIEGQDEIVLNEDGLSRMWFYRADLGGWVRLNEVEIDGFMPFPKEFDDAFIALLAFRINPRMGRTIDAQTQSWLERSMTQLKARYRQKPTIPADYGAVALTRFGYGHSGVDEFPHPNGWMN